MINPGMPARKKAQRQLKAVAIMTSTSGATKEPRRAAVDSTATRDCATGRKGPSAAPISRRVRNRLAHEPVAYSPGMNASLQGESL